MRPQLKRYGTKLISLFLSSALLLSAVACSTGGDSSLSDIPSNSSAKGRYVEEEFSLPGGDGNIPLSLDQTGDKLRLTSSEGIFDSSDNGKTWEKVAFEAEAPETFSSPAAWGTDGSAVFTTSDDSGKSRYWLMDKSRKKRELVLNLPENETFTDGVLLSGSDDKSGAPEDSSEDSASSAAETSVASGSSAVPENSIQKFSFLHDGSLRGLDQNGVLDHIDPETGSFLHTLEATGPYNQYIDFVLTTDTLLVRSYDGVDLFHLTDWTLKERDSVLEDFLNSSRQSTGNPEATVQTNVSSSGNVFLTGDILLFSDRQDDSIYLCSQNGVYRHILGGSSIEQVINGALNTLSDPTFHVQKILKLSDDSFTLLGWNETDESHKLLNYLYDPNMSAVPEKELKAYAFSDSTELRQAIAMYQKANPDIYINLELALSGSDAMTVSDALRTLNTNIMAGKGPDVIFLDGMPVQNYLQKGLLTEIGDLVKEVEDSDGLFENILSAYKTDEGYYAVPTRFVLPILDADKESLSSVHDLASLADAVDKLRKEHPDQKSVTGLTDAASLLKALYPAKSPAWFQTDGTLKQDALSEFLQQAKRIFDTNLPDEDGGDPQDGLGYASVSFGKNGMAMGTELTSGNSLISLENFSSIGGLPSLVSVNDKMQNYGYAPQPGQAGNVFLPAGVVGINAKSSQQEEAKTFVKFLLSSEVQAIDQGLGMPVNKKTFEQLCQVKDSSLGGIAVISSDSSYSINLTFRKPTEEEYDALRETVEGLEIPATQDTIILDAVLQSGQAYLEGKLELNDAVQEILKKVALYLSE